MPLLALLGIAGCRQLIGLTDENAVPESPDAGLSDAAADGGGPDAAVPCKGIDCAPPSCAAGGPDGGKFRLHQCGKDGSEDCCATITIDGGSVELLPDGGGASTVGPYRLDKFEVTAGRMHVFVEAGLGIQKTAPKPGEGAHPRIPLSGWDSAWNTPMHVSSQELAQALYQCSGERRGTYDDEDPRTALTCATWLEAFAFCIWDGGRLPTEAEWQFAATGGRRERHYPFADDLPDGGAAGYAAYCRFGTLKSDAGGLTIDNFQCGDQPSAQRVGFYSPKGDGPFGHADLAGNAFEHVFDWYFPSRDSCSGQCAVLSSQSATGTPSTMRVTRGGGYRFSEGQLENFVRDGYPPANRHTSMGFRCARDF